MKIFVTGGPRNGTTLIMQLIIALGYNNSGLKIRLGNCEDTELKSVIDSILTSRFLLNSDIKKRKFDKYFKKVFKKSYSSKIALKFPLLECSPNLRNEKGSNQIEMVENNIYKEFVASITENFDIIFFCYRQPLAAANSELKYFKKDLKFNLNDIEKEKFYKSYTRAHQQTSEYINNIIKKSNLNCKIINLNFDDLLSNPSKFILDLSSNINLRNNPLVIKWLSDFINKDGSRNKDIGRSNVTFTVISKFLGQLNNSFGCFEDENLDNPSYRKNLLKMYSHLDKYRI